MVTFLFAVKYLSIYYMAVNTVWSWKLYLFLSYKKNREISFDIPNNLWKEASENQIDKTVTLFDALNSIGKISLFLIGEIIMLIPVRIKSQK